MIFLLGSAPQSIYIHGFQFVTIPLIHAMYCVYFYHKVCGSVLSTIKCVHIRYDHQGWNFLHIGILLCF
jgi:hypothetical protein